MTQYDAPTTPDDASYTEGVQRRESEIRRPSTLGAGCCGYCGAPWSEHKAGECPEWTEPTAEV